jgi:type I pantothenate kinase
LAAEAAARAAEGGTRRPVLVGITGGVGVGKSTAAARIREHLSRASVRTVVLCTDVFLLPNATLEQLGRQLRKGFPESFDAEALDACLRALRAGDTPVRVPVYSHATYDRVPGEVQELDAADVVIVEGVNALQPPVVDHLDLAVYIEADEDDMRDWFVTRFLAFCADPDAAFYRGFATMSDAQRRGVAEWTWREINAVNLRDHIAPSRARATRVLTKRRDHSFGSVDP